MTTNTSDVVSAIRELTTTKQLERTELLDLLKDGLHAALVKRYGPNVRAEIGIDELKGTIRIAVLRTVVETVEDPGTQVALEEARFEDPDFRQKFLSVVPRELERINTIVERLLELARPARLTFKPLRLPALLERVLELYGDRLEAQSIRVVRDWRRDVYRAGDGDRIVAREGQRDFAVVAAVDVAAHRVSPKAQAAGRRAPTANSRRRTARRRASLIVTKG